MHTKPINTSNLTFVDLFAGCGGLSLGLAQAGLRGLFAIERDKLAFSTFEANFLGERNVPIRKFDWPVWLNKAAWPIDELLDKHVQELLSMRGKVDVIGGGPPCQGFSFAGRRKEDDPRNMLFERYIRIVDAIRPRAVVLENVPGMKVAHRCNSNLGSCTAPKTSYFDKLKRNLDEIGYEAEGEIVDASDYGVPQRRARLIVIGIRKDVVGNLKDGVKGIFKLLEARKAERKVTAQEAISDLCTTPVLKDCTDPFSPPGFQESYYISPKTQYQEMMHLGCKHDEMDSMRQARHTHEVRERFRRILAECRPGVVMDKASREKYGLKKHRVHPMAWNEPAPTITTLPEDILHYEEPRILTVRESARLQSFPDWFRFRGKFTTGGQARTKECPRYTQVGNAVPPLLGKAIGEAITEALEQANQIALGNASRVSDVAKRELAIET